jgi:hypothetical protein
MGVGSFHVFLSDGAGRVIFPAVPVLGEDTISAGAFPLAAAVAEAGPAAGAETELGAGERAGEEMDVLAGGVCSSEDLVKRLNGGVTDGH